MIPSYLSLKASSAGMKLLQGTTFVREMEKIEVTYRMEVCIKI